VSAKNLTGDLKFSSAVFFWLVVQAVMAAVGKDLEVNAAKNPPARFKPFVGCSCFGYRQQPDCTPRRTCSGTNCPGWRLIASRSGCG